MKSVVQDVKSTRSFRSQWGLSMQLCFLSAHWFLSTEHSTFVGFYKRRGNLFERAALPSFFSWFITLWRSLGVCSRSFKSICSHSTVKVSSSNLRLKLIFAHFLNSWSNYACLLHRKTYFSAKQNCLSGPSSQNLLIGSAYLRREHRMIHQHQRLWPKTLLPRAHKF